MRTDGVKKLVEEVLATLTKPHTEDVIDEVFQAIERKPEWHLRYDNLVRELDKTVVNTWAGWWIANSEGKSGAHQVRAKSSLIESYSQLTRPARKAGKNIKEADALKIMSQHYQANKTELPRSIVKSRELILELLMAGFAAEEAFSKAMARARQ
jgi:hypothetical protein